MIWIIWIRRYSLHLLTLVAGYEDKKDQFEAYAEANQEYKNDLQNLVVDWKEDKAHIRLQARGYNTAGTLEVKDSVVDLDFYMPFLLQVFSKKIKSIIQNQLQQSLA